MYKALRAWISGYDTELRRPSDRKGFGYGFVLSVLGVVGLYLIGFGLLRHTFRLLWLADKANHKGIYWSGWNNTAFIFAFGDSYTTTSFDVHGIQPTPDNPLGNQDVGYLHGTQVNTSNYIMYLTSKYNESLILTYNFAWAGGTVDNSIDQSPFGSLDFHDQVRSQFAPNFGNEQKYRSWSANNSMFMIFIGINDVILFKSKPNASEYIPAVAQSYAKSTETLYENGARNFLFINVPAVERSPSGVSMLSGTTAEEEAEYIHGLNAALLKLIKAFTARHRDATAFLLDSNALFTRVLDDPKIYPITSVIRNTTEYCKPYEQMPDEKFFDPFCGIPRNEYFWSDNLHPTSTVHEIMADRIVKEALQQPL